MTTRIIYDRHIPFVAEAIERAGWEEVRLYPLEPQEITNEALRDLKADILLIRTRTRVDRELLDWTQVRCVMTATIGCDHIDMHYCRKHLIRVRNCPGCNAKAVADYVREAIKETRKDWRINLDDNGVRQRDWLGHTIGIIGYGNVGRQVELMAYKKGMNILIYDPYTVHRIMYGRRTTLDELAAESDVVTFHTPLTMPNPRLRYPTYHLGNAELFARMKYKALVINSARGGVVDEKALRESHLKYVIDTWENEPNIDLATLEASTFATCHIAGYSAQGKCNASQMCLDYLADMLGQKPVKIDPAAVRALAAEGDTTNGWIRRLSADLKAAPDQFEAIRKRYRLR